MLSHPISKKFSFLALLLFWPAIQESSFAQVTKELERPVIGDPEEYVVYSKLLASRFTSKDVKQLVISKSTVSKEEGYIGTIGGITFSGAKQPETEVETSTDFDAKNEKSFELANNLTLDIPYAVVAPEDMRKLFHEEGQMIGRDEWKKFYESYPGSSGIIALSRVAFNSKKDQALVYVIHQSGLVGGAGRFFVLAKQNNSWKIQKEVLIWLS